MPVTNNNDKGRQITATYKKLVDRRMPLERHWKDAFEYTYPVRGEGFLGMDTDGITRAVSAQAKTATIYDSTSTDSVRLLASSILSGLTPSHSQWFDLQVPNVSESVIPRDAKQWLQDAATTLFNMIHSSNYNAVAYEFFVDMAIGGQAGLFIEWSKDHEFHFEFWPLSGLYCQDTLKRERVDTIYRKCKLTAAQAIEKFGPTVPQDVKDEFQRDPYCDKLFEYVHTIRPRMIRGKQSYGKMARNMAWESVYVCLRSNEVVYESGFEEMPVIVPRWMRIPDTDYATGPFNEAMPDAKTLNKIVEMVLQNGEMQIAGTFVAKDDGVLNPNTIKIGARKIVSVADVDSIKPLTSGGDMKFAQIEIDRIQRQIKRVMMADQLEPFDKKYMTAEEVGVRTQTIRQILAPIFGRLQTEYLEPLIARCFGLALRAQAFGEIPDSVKAFRFTPTYHSPIARAQKMETLNAMDQLESRLAMASKVQPEVLDLYDFDLAISKKADLLGVPVELIRDPRQVQQIRDARVQQQQQSQEQAMQAEMLGQLTKQAA
jgi:hypothetical protein